MPSVAELLSPIDLAVATRGGRYRSAKHLRLMEREVIDMFQPGGADILICEAPPRHGKTEFLSKTVPTWYHSVWPEKRSILATYGLTLSRKASRFVRDEVHRLAPIFENGGVSRALATATDWEMANGIGGMVAAGVGGGIVGRAADLFIIDDFIKNAEEALSENNREAQWEWFQSVVTTRLEPGAKVIILACLVGDTKVSMADGTEKQMRSICVGDEVLTFDQGKIGKSKVVNFADVGHDDVLAIRTESGRVIRANARHPFLVVDEGKLKWIRTRNLNMGHKIVVLKGNGANGRVFDAHGMGVNRMLNAGGCAQSTTIAKRDWMVTSRLHLSALGNVGRTRFVTDMVSTATTTTECSKTRMVNARFADAHQQRPTLALIKPLSSASITAMIQAWFEGYCATIATLQPATLKPDPPQLHLLDTSEFTTEAILRIDPDGHETVFDLEVQETGSFIANGAVTHNTRWHADDLIGRIQQWAQEDNGEEKMSVRSISLPALAEPTEEKPDPLGRQTDEALWPERFDTAALKKKRAILESYWWNALYQQRLGSYGKNEWPSEYFMGIFCEEDEWPDKFVLSATALDPSKGKDAKKGDPSAIVFVGWHNGCFWVDADIEVRPVPKMVRDLIQMNRRYRPAVCGIEAVAFQELLGPAYMAACEELGWRTDMPEMIENTVSKWMRIVRLGKWLEKRKIRIRRTRGTDILVKQMKEFPNGDHDDGPDGLEMAMRCLFRLLDKMEGVSEVVYSDA